jgi:hypothetical protein
VLLRPWGNTASTDRRQVHGSAMVTLSLMKNYRAYPCTLTTAVALVLDFILG